MLKVNYKVYYVPFQVYQTTCDDTKQMKLILEELSKQPGVLRVEFLHCVEVKDEKKRKTSYSYKPPKKK